MNLGSKKDLSILFFLKINKCYTKIYFLYFRLRHTSVGDKYVLIFRDENPLKKVILYNSVPRQRTKVQTLVVSTPFVRVTDRMGQAVQCQVSPIWIGPAALTVARYELSFLVTVPGFGITTYIIHALPKSSFPQYVILLFKLLNIYFFHATSYCLLYIGKCILRM